MIFRVGLAILKSAEQDLMSLDMEGMITVSDYPISQKRVQLRRY